MADSTTTPGVCWWLAMDICFGTDRCIPDVDCEAYHPAADWEPTPVQNPTTLTMADGSLLTVRDDMEVRCYAHGIVTTWGALDPIQQLAVEEGIDASDDLPCLLEPRRG